MKITDRLIIHVTEVKEEGLEVKGQLPASVLDVGGDEEDRQSCPNPLEYDLTAFRVSHGLLVKGSAWTIARCRCDRCLHYFDMELRADDVCHFAEHLPEGQVDLTDDVREDVVILLPALNLCKEDCLGICPQCGVNLNVRGCDCPPQDAVANPWHQLDDLNL